MLTAHESAGIFEGNITSDHSQHQEESTESKVIQHAHRLPQLIAEKETCGDIESSIEQRAQAVEQEEAADAHSKGPGQRRHHCAQSWNEFRSNQCLQTVALEEILCAANARVARKGQAAEQPHYTVATPAAYKEPERIGDDGSQGGQANCQRQVELTS